MCKNASNDITIIQYLFLNWWRLFANVTEAIAGWDIYIRRQVFPAARDSLWWVISHWDYYLVIITSLHSFILWVLINLLSNKLSVVENKGKILLLPSFLTFQTCAVNLIKYYPNWLPKIDRETKVKLLCNRIVASYGFCIIYYCPKFYWEEKFQSCTVHNRPDKYCIPIVNNLTING